MREIQKLYLAQVFPGILTIATVTYPLFLLSNGITHTQIALLFSVFMITMALLEIPTGGVADTFGHKASVVLGLLVHSIHFLIFFFASTFYGFLAGMVMASLGLALISGAYSSLVHDILDKLGKRQDFTKVWGRMDAIFLVGTLFASPAGMIIFKYQPRLPYLLAFFSLLIGAFIVQAVKWEFKGTKPAVNVYFSKMTKGVSLALRNRRIIALVIIGVALSTARLLMNQNIGQPYLLSVGFDITHLGFVAAAIAGVSAIVSVTAHRIAKKIGAVNSLALMVLIPAVSAFILSQLNTLFALVFLIVFYFGHAFREPVMAYLGQKEVADEQRATMISTISFLVSITVGLLLPLGGRTIDVYGIHSSLLFLGLFVTLVGLTGIFIYHKNSTRE